MPCKFEKDVHDDSAVSFILNKNVRGRFIRLDESLNSILSQHKYPDSVCNLICEAVLLTVMIGQALKLRWKLSIQMRPTMVCFRVFDGAQKVPQREMNW